MAVISWDKVAEALDILGIEWRPEKGFNLIKVEMNSDSVVAIYDKVEEGELRNYTRLYPIKYDKVGDVSG